MPRLKSDGEPYNVMMTLEDVDVLESLQVHPAWKLWGARLKEKNEYVAHLALGKGDTEFDKGQAAGHVEASLVLKELIDEAKGNT